jgi:uncharacterized membrane protein YtjA (UPF0391 family)
MRGWLVLFAVASVLGAAVGFGGAPRSAAALGQLLFFISLIAAGVSLVLRVLRGTPPAA